MTDEIDVILIDDSSIVIEGLKRALRTAQDIRVIGEYSVSDVKNGALSSCSGAVILLGVASLKNPGSDGLIGSIKRSLPLVKIIVVVNEEFEVDWVRSLGADEAIKARGQHYQLVNLVQGLFKDDKSLCEYYFKLLKTIVPGKADEKKYETVMGEIIHLLFSEHLVMDQPQSSTFSKRKRRDFILYNISTHTFWQFVKYSYRADQVIFEFKNTAETHTDHVIQLNRYLRPPMGSFGILTERVLASDPVWKEQMELCKGGTIILLITDDDIHTMLAFKAAGFEPTGVLEELYTYLVRQSE